VCAVGQGEKKFLNELLRFYSEPKMINEDGEILPKLRLRSKEKEEEERRDDNGVCCCC
jgi:hypothetical protein